MPSISKIPQHINQYATRLALEINNEPVENAMTIGDYNKYIRLSDPIKGAIGWTVVDVFDKSRKDIIVHNHPNGVVLSMQDVITAIAYDIKKIFASTNAGFTALDLTTTKKSISKNELLARSVKANEEMEIFANKLFVQQSIKPDINFYDIDQKIIKKMDDALDKEGYLKLKEFAKWSGAIFSDVKWSDYAKSKK